MSLLMKYSYLTRMMIIILAAVLVYVASVNFLGTASSTTDENLFKDSPSRFYLVKQISVYDTTKQINKKKSIVNPGVLVLKIDNYRLSDTTNLKEVYNNITEKDYVEIIVLNTYSYKKHKFKVNLKELMNGSISFLSSAVIVLEVYEGGASDRAGMLAGDLIIRINGEQFRNMYAADNLLQLARSGQVIKYEVLRNNQIVTLNLIPVKFGLTFLSILQLAAFLLAVAFGSFISLKRPNIPGALFLGVGLMLFASYLSITYARVGVFTGYSLFTVLRALTIYFTLPFSLAFLLYSTFHFPYKIKLANKRWIKYSLFSFAGLFFFLSSINSLWLKSPIIDWIINYSIIIILIFYLIIRIVYRKDYSKEYKKANRPIFIFFTIYFLLRFLLPVMRNIDLQFFVISNYLLTIVFILVLFSYYYVIAKHRLLDLKIRIKRNIQYSLITLTWRIAAIFILILILIGISKLSIEFPNIHIEGTNIEVLNTPLSPELQSSYSKIFIIVISIIATILWWKFKKFVQSLLDKRYHRTSLDYRRATSDLSKLLAHNFSLDDLTCNIAKELADLTHLKKVGIIVLKEESKIVGQDYYGIQNTELKELLQASGAKVSETLKEHHDDFLIEYLPEPLNNILNDFGFKIIQPIYSKNKLLGALLIGEKMSESSFNKDDFDFIHTISGQISVAIENSFLYENLTHQERIKHELDIARRIQLASLPDSIPNVSGLEISGISIPALEVGGDFYDFLDTENGEFMVIIGDVSGKGTSAALYMSKIQGIMRTLHQFRLSPRQLLIQTNHLLYRYLEKGYFISATSVNFDIPNSTAAFSRAGHLPLYLFEKRSSEVRKITYRGMVLGLTRDKTFERNLDETEIYFSTGDIFVLITDGISEAKNHLMQEYSDETLIEIIKQNHSKSAEQIRDIIVRSVRDFADSDTQYDDMTVVVVKIK